MSIISTVEDLSQGTLVNAKFANGLLKLENQKYASFVNNHFIQTGGVLQGFPNPLTEITVEFYAKPKKVQSLNTSLVCQNPDNLSNRLLITLPFSSQILFHFGDATGAGPGIQNVNYNPDYQNEVAHYAFTAKESGQQIIYRNGNILGQRSLPAGNTMDTSGKIRVGNFADGSLDWEGDLYYLRIWKKQRTQSEIQNNLWFLSGDLADLVFWWKLDEGTGTTISDSSGQSNDAAATISGWNTDTTRFVGSGTQTSDTYDLSSIADSVDFSKLDWTATVPANTTLTVETNVSFDGGANWEGWMAHVSGNPIAGIANRDVSNGLLQIRRTLSTTDVAASPSVSESSFRLQSVEEPLRLDVDTSLIEGNVREVKLL